MWQDRHFIKSYLMIVFAFSLPISTSATSIIGCLIMLLWLAEGQFFAKWQEAKGNKIFLTTSAYVLLFAIGLLWTENLEWGFEMLSKQWKFLLLPILLTSLHKAHTKHYLLAFLAAMILATAVSYALWAASVIGGQNFNNWLAPTPFMSRITYSPFLAFSIYLICHNLLFTSPATKKIIIGGGLVILMVINLFLSGGRTGQVAFFALMFLLAFQYCPSKPIRTFFISAIALACVFISGYLTSDTFRGRIDEAVVTASHYQESPESSMGQRLTFLANSVVMVKNHPWFGVGTGDYPQEYQKINSANSPRHLETDNPHNQYLFVLCMFGAFGLIIFMAIFYYQFTYAVQWQDDLKHIRLALPFFYSIIMLGGTYLLDHATTLFFVLFSAVLFKEQFYQSIR